MPTIGKVIVTMAVAARTQSRRRQQDRANTPSQQKAAMIAAQRALDFPQDQPYA